MLTLRCPRVSRRGHPAVEAQRPEGARVVPAVPGGGRLSAQQGELERGQNPEVGQDTQTGAFTHNI